MKAPSHQLRRAAKWLAAIAVVLLVAAAVWMGSVDGPGDLLAHVIVIAWQAGPILLATVFAHASRDRAGQLIFLLLAVAQILFATFIFVDVLRSTRSTAVLALVFYPLLEYAAWAVVAGVAASFGWRGRDDWLKG